MPWNWKSWFTGGGNNNNTRSSPARNNRRSRSKSCSKSRSRHHASSNSNLPPLIVKQMSQTLKDLECPLCHNTCTPPIYTCLKGHIVCSGCRLATTTCPICSEQYSTVRNLFAEQFVLQYSQKCRYAKEGCGFLKWKGCDMRPHETSCFYRPIQCIVQSCPTMDNEVIRYHALLPHLIDTHKIQGCTRLPAWIHFQTDGPLIADRRWLPYYIKAFDCDFYLMLEVRRPHFFAWVWVQPPKLPQNMPNNMSSPGGSSVTGYGDDFIFISSLEFQNQEKGLSFKWSGPVHFIRTPASAIVQEGLCFSAGEILMQHFESTEKMISVRLNIEKKALKYETTPAPVGHGVIMKARSNTNTSAGHNAHNRKHHQVTMQSRMEMESTCYASNTIQFERDGNNNSQVIEQQFVQTDQKRVTLRKILKDLNHLNHGHGHIRHSGHPGHSGHSVNSGHGHSGRIGHGQIEHIGNGQNGNGRLRSRSKESRPQQLQIMPPTPKSKEKSVMSD